MRGMNEFSSNTVKEVLEAAKKHSDISARVAELNAKNLPTGKLIGDRISAFEVLRTRLVLLDMQLSKLKHFEEERRHDWISKTNWENES
jgi:hypothetical protein